MVRITGHTLIAQLLVATALAARPTVTIASGVVVGTTTTIPAATGHINKYIGIPYAESPPERFSPPKHPASWTKPLDAVETQPNCMQQFTDRESKPRELQVFYYPAGPPKTESEDCMYLNVYTPPSTNSSSKKAVMFYMFGGNQEFGSGGFFYFDGSSFAHNQDVVVVTPNARTNVFGFSSSPEISMNLQNVGLLDFRFALDWVQNNIHKFGGDPSKVTIFGESSGATDAKHLVAMPPKPVPFRAAIFQSDASSNLGEGSDSWKKLIKDQGCAKAASPIKCMRKRPAKALKQAIEHLRLPFPPTIDDHTYTKDIRPFVQAGTAAKVPILLGTLKDDGLAFAYQRGLEGPDASFQQFLKSFFPGRGLLQTLLSNQFGLEATRQPYYAAGQVITDSSFLCRTSALANFLQLSGYPVHRYLYDATFPNLNYFPHHGVFHSSDIPLIFGTYSRQRDTKKQHRFSRFVQTAWANFAKNPSNGPGWPALGSEGNIGHLQTKSGVETVNAAQVDQNCTVYKILINQKGL